MGFLAPYLLWGAAAAAIPIALHFFFRSRYRTVPWAAMKFLLTSVEQTSRRLRFQELLLLMLRVTMLILLAVALARPISSAISGIGRGDAVDAAFVFDTSFSMGAADGARTRLERAQNEALKIIDRLPPHSTVQIITCAGNGESLVGPRSPANLDQARHLIKELRTTHLTTDLFKGVERAAAVLAKGQSANKELYVFSDMQQQGWEKHAGSLTQLLNEIKDQAAVALVRCGTQAPKNASLVGITPQSGVPRPGERVGFAALVRNTGKEPVTDVKVSLTANDDDKTTETQTVARLDPGETRAVTLASRFDQPGLHVVTARINHDGLEGDNRFDQVVQVRDHVNVLVIDGNLNEREPAQSSSYFLTHALTPVKDADRAGYHVQPRVIPPRLASPALLARQDLCVLVNVALQPRLGSRTEPPPADFVEELGRFVRQGKGLLIFGGDNVQAEAYNRLLGKQGLLPLPLKDAQGDGKSPRLVDRASFKLPAFWSFRDDDYYKDFAKVEIWRAIELDEPARAEGEKADVDPFTVALRTSDGKPLVATRKLDAGEVAFVATAADAALDVKTLNPAWTDWPLHIGVYVPFVQVLVSHLLHGQSQTYNVTAGEPLSWYPTEKTLRSYTLVHPDGEKVRLGLPEKKGNRSVVTAADLPRAGVYRLLAIQPRGEGETEAVEPRDAGTPIAAVPDLREVDDLGTYSDAQLDERLGFTPIHLTADAEEEQSAIADRLNREWTTYLLWAVFGLVVGESLLAWFCGRAW